MSAVVRAGYKLTEVGVIPEDWEVDALGAHVVITSGLSPTLLRFETTGTPYFKVDQLNNEPKYLTTTPYFFRGEQAVPKESLIFPKRGASILLNKVRILVHDAFMDTNLMTLTPKETLNPEYFYYALTHIQLWRIVDTTSIPQINNKHIIPLVLPRPSISEQRAIATALSDVDALLAKLDALIAKKRDLKVATMQQLLTGQTRLPGFSGAWEVKRLGDVGDCLRGVTYKGDNDLWPHDTAHTRRLLRSNNVQNSTVVLEDIQFVNSDRVSVYQLLRANDILICMANGSKALVGKAGLFNVNDGYDYTFGAFMGCFRSDTSACNSSFVFYLFQTGQYRNYINNLLAGSSINNLSPSSIKSLEFSVPPMPEQTAIATILFDMDTELTALEARRDKTRVLKQGMMQVLLTGEIRLL